LSTVPRGNPSHFPVPVPANQGSLRPVPEINLPFPTASLFDTLFDVCQGGCLQPSPSYNVAQEGNFPRDTTLSQEYVTQSSSQTQDPTVQQQGIFTEQGANPSSYFLYLRQSMCI
jgi:hypothetical protein